MDNEGVVAMIQRTPYAIGYADYGQAKRLGLRMATLQNRSGNYVHPTNRAGDDALLKTELPDDFRVFTPDPAGEGSYPIITYTWILTHRSYTEPKTGTALRSFLEWCLTEGQRDCETLGYVRLPSEVARRAVEAVRKIH
jgi:phosphate transport system substrate-binding protein